MELINNIWMALSTLNEALVRMLNIPLFFVENFLLMSLFLLLANKKTNLKSKIIYVSISSIVSIISLNIFPKPLYVFINYIIFILLASKIFNIHILISMIIILATTLIFNLISALILNPFLAITKISAEQLLITPIYEIIFLLTIYSILFFIVLLLKKINIAKYKLDNIDHKTKNIIFINFILGTCALILHSIITFYYINFLPIVITFISFIILFAYLMVNIYSMTRVIKLVQTKEQLETAEEYNKTLRILHDNVRGFKHDFDNIVTTIGGFIKTNDMDGLQKYYYQLEDDCQKVSSLYVLNPEIINNPGIYNLLSLKHREAESKNIKVNMSLLLDLNDLKMKIYEFARILGILLDNAIEASEECEDKIINIIFRDDDKRHRQLITIENTFKNKDVDTTKIFGKGISGKPNHTGLGLWEVNKILRKNTNVSLFTSKNDKYFSQQLEIYY